MNEPEDQPFVGGGARDSWVAFPPVSRHGELVELIRRPAVTDGALTLAIAAVGVYSSLGSHGHSVRPGAVALALFATLPLFVRRANPPLVLAVVVGATAAAAIVYSSYWPLGAMVGFYTLAAYCRRRNAIVFGVAALSVLAAPIASASSWQSTLSLLRLALFVGAWVLGDNLRTRRAYLRALEERTAQLEREREANARRAAAEEQARIAREVHDIVAHNLSVIVVQATAADAVFVSQPDDARQAVRTIERTARQALEELRRVLGVVRSRDLSSGELAPQPKLANLNALADQVRAAGIDVNLEMVGEAAELPAAFQVSAYRIVQEALTNTLRHSGAKHATVTVGFDPAELRLEIVDDGTPGTSNGDGRGLAGMRERAAMFGGTVEAGPRHPVGFRVAARMPIATGQ